MRRIQRRNAKRTLGLHRVVVIATAGVVCGLGMVLAQDAVAAHATAVLYDYTSTSFSGQCADGGSGTVSQGSVQVSRTGSTISVSIQLVGVQPNTTYNAGLLQAGACLHQSTVRSITTDSNGDGSLQFSEKAVAPPSRDPLIVDVAGPIVCATPCTITSEPSPVYRTAVLKV